MAKLTEDQIQAIFDAPTDEATPDLATRLNAEYFTVNSQRRRLYKGEWRCLVYFLPCSVCGGMLIARNRTHTTHPVCIAARENARSRQYRAEGKVPSSTSYVAKWRAEHPDRVHELREQDKARMRREWREKPPEERADDLAKAHESDVWGQERTRDRAYNTGAEWPAEDDAWLIEHNHLSARAIALTLSRTLYSVKARRVLLRKRGLLA